MTARVAALAALALSLTLAPAPPVEALGSSPVPGVFNLPGFGLPDGARLFDESLGRAEAKAKSQAGVEADGLALVLDGLQRCGDAELLTAFDARGMMRKAEAGPWANFVGLDVSKDPSPNQVEVSGFSQSRVVAPGDGPSATVTMQVALGTRDLGSAGRARQLWCGVEFSGVQPAKLGDLFPRLFGRPADLVNQPSPDSQKTMVWWAVQGPNGPEAAPGDGPPQSLADAFARTGRKTPILMLNYIIRESPIAPYASVSFFYYQPL